MRKIDRLISAIVVASCVVLGNLAKRTMKQKTQITEYVQPTRDGEIEQWRVTFADGERKDMDSFEVHSAVSSSFSLSLRNVSSNRVDMHIGNKNFEC